MPYALHLTSPTNPTHVAVSSDIMKKGFSATRERNTPGTPEA
jgi:hypothetical protein